MIMTPVRFYAITLVVLSQTAGAAPTKIPATIEIPAGAFIMGSDRAERDSAYRLDEAAYGHTITRDSRWYESEPKRTKRVLPTFHMTRTPITNAQYEAFVRASGRPAPDVDEVTWKSYGLIHPYSRTRRHAWIGGDVPAGRGNHPVVMVSHHDALAYAEWLSRETGITWRLPTETEWEKAARGDQGSTFPWGNEFLSKRLNSHDDGPFDTLPVGEYPNGASPYGLLDAAGQVFEWTATKQSDGRYWVKGGSWDDKGCGICRPAARHGRPEQLKHILIGFRLVRETG